MVHSTIVCLVLMRAIIKLNLSPVVRGRCSTHFSFRHFVCWFLALFWGFRESDGAFRLLYFLHLRIDTQIARTKSKTKWKQKQKHADFNLWIEWSTSNNHRIWIFKSQHNWRVCEWARAPRDDWRFRKRSELLKNIKKNKSVFVRRCGALNCVWIVVCGRSHHIITIFWMNLSARGTRPHFCCRLWFSRLSYTAAKLMLTHAPQIRIKLKTMIVRNC